MNVSNGTLIMTSSVISGNRAITESSTSADVGAAGSALEVDGGGTISNTLITGNYATMVSPHGAAAVNGALGLFGNTSLLTVRNSTISGNTATATSTTGSASVQGAGIFNDGLLKLTGDHIRHNSGTATGPSGEAQGGGIWNGATFTGPPVQLTLQRHGRHPQLADREPRLHGARRRPVHEVTGHHHPQALTDRAQHPRPVLRLLNH